MKRLLLILTILTCTHSLHSMDPTSLYELRRTGIEIPNNLSPITLPQIYHHFAKTLLPEIAFHIFSLQPGSHLINRPVTIIKGLSPEAMADPNHKDRDKAQPMLYLIALQCERLRNQVGHCLMVEILKRNFLRKKMLICDMKGHDGETFLHHIAQYKSATVYGNLGLEAGGNHLLKICLEVDSNHLLKALTAQDNLNQTVLHHATGHGNVEFVKLLLCAAGNDIQDFMNMLDKDGKTAFDIATPEIKAIMLPYMQNNQ